MRRMRHWLLVLGLSLSAGLSAMEAPSVAHAARIWTVCNADAGCSFTPDFSAIQPAISAAGDGDTIDVYGSPTAYSGGLGIGISISLDGMGTGTVTVSGGGPVITV